MDRNNLLAVIGIALQYKDLDDLIATLQDLVDDLEPGEFDEARACLDMALAGNAVLQAVFTTIEQKLGRPITLANADLDHIADLADAASY